MPLDARRTVGLQPRLGECCRETSYSLPGARKTASYSSLSRRPCLLRGLEAATRCATIGALAFAVVLEVELCCRCSLPSGALGGVEARARVRDGFWAL